MRDKCMGKTPPACCFLKYLRGQNIPILSSLAFFSKWTWGSSDGWFKKSWPVNRPFLGFCCISASILPKTSRIHHNINLWVEGLLPEKIHLLPVSLSCTTPLFRVCMNWSRTHPGRSIRSLVGSLQLVPFLELACHCKPRDFLFFEIFAVMQW